MSLALRERSTRFSIDGATIPIPAGDCVGAGDLATLRCHIGLSRRDVELSVAETRPGPPQISTAENLCFCCFAIAATPISAYSQLFLGRGGAIHHQAVAPFGRPR